MPEDDPNHFPGRFLFGHPFAVDKSEDERQIDEWFKTMIPEFLSRRTMMCEVELVINTALRDGVLCPRRHPTPRIGSALRDLVRRTTPIIAAMDAISIAQKAGAVLPKALDEFLQHQPAACLSVPVDSAGEVDRTGDATEQAGKAPKDGGEEQRNALGEPLDGISYVFPSPEGATWDDVQLKFTNGETIRIQVGDTDELKTAAELGMADGRNKNPNQQFKLLRDLAEEKGKLKRDPDLGKQDAQRKVVNRLRKDLTRIFSTIKGDPIERLPKFKGWKTAFHIRPE
ncbi:MAG: hypothetical protein AMXMBFR82_49080 [Candidatus Hydrogenedentota bacterium]